jgi:hypothetical protein
VMSRFRLQCGEEDFADLSELIGKFDAQVRGQVSGQRDLASLILLRVASLNGLMLRSQLKKFCRRELSLGYANMGQLGAGLQTFQGLAIQELHSIAMPWTTGSLVMTSHQIGTRVFVSAASIEEIVPRAELIRFLERLELHLTGAV